MEKSKFLNQTYPELADSEPVSRSVKKKIRENPALDYRQISDEEKLDIHLERIEKILDYKNKKGDSLAAGWLKGNIVENAVIRVTKKDGEENTKLLKEISRNLFKGEKEIAKQEGRGAEVSQVEDQLGGLSKEEKDSKLIEIYKSKILESEKAQRESLRLWLDYLTSGDSNYPTWFKYLIVKSISKLGQLDEENKEFRKRFPQTLVPFPELNQEALGLVYTAITEHPDEQRDFNKLYANALVEIKNERREVLSDRGNWGVITKGTDPHIAMERIKGYGTGWCIATNLADMEKYLKNGDLHVYFSEDEKGNKIVPRVCIYLENGQVKEIRGIAENQNLEGRMTAITDAKKKELPGGDVYDKRSADMKFLTDIENKVKEGQKLTKDDLVFLYETNSSIEGFGYQKDPRIAELRKGRNTEEDMLVIFECTKDQIAHVPSEINDSTKAYVGQLESGIFQKLPEKLEHVYTSFPDKKIRRENIEIGGKSAEQLISEMETAGIKISNYAKSMLKSREFVIGKNPEEVTLVRLTVADLGFKTSATIDQIYERVQTFGLDLCPPNTGPHYRLKYQNQSMNEWIYVGMKQIAGSVGYPFMFRLARYDDGLWLDDFWAEPTNQWGLDGEFVFRLRKSES